MARRRSRTRVTFGRLFKQGNRMVCYGYRGGKKVGLYAHKAARTYSKARYTYKQAEHAYTLIRKISKR